MPQHLIDAMARHAVRQPGSADPAGRPERRQRPRTPVRWPLTLWRDDGAAPIETATHDLSSTGFYCLSPAPLTPGETLHCALRVPTFDPHDDQRHIALECRALVVRAEAAADGFFGVACHIEEYHLAGGAGEPKRIS